jgi:hypothetical protein
MDGTTTTTTTTAAATARSAMPPSASSRVSFPPPRPWLPCHLMMQQLRPHGGRVCCRRALTAASRSHGIDRSGGVPPGLLERFSGKALSLLVRTFGRVRTHTRRALPAEMDSEEGCLSQATPGPAALILIHTRTFYHTKRNRPQDPDQPCGRPARSPPSSSWRRS